VGTDNDYSHPAASSLSRLSGSGIQLFRTDQNGTIVATCDGESVTFNKPIPSSVPSTLTPSTPPSPVSKIVSIASIDLAGEVVTIVNNGSTAADLTGWKLVSEQGNQTYSFPGGTTIPSGGTLKVMSGSKAVASAGTLGWTKSNMWNNDGDPGVLYDAQGQVVSRK